MMRPKSEGGQGYDDETARKVCGKLQAQLEAESFSWIGDLKPFGRNLIRGKALHPIKTIHPGEWPSTRVYLEEELEKAAHSLAGTPLKLDHIVELPPPNRVLAAEYEDGAVEYVAEVSPDVRERILSGRIHSVSVEYDWRTMLKLNGVAPQGITFTGLSLLERFPPGDPEATVELWESYVAHRRGLSEQILRPNEFIWGLFRDPGYFAPDRFCEFWLDQPNGIKAIVGEPRLFPGSQEYQSILFLKKNGWTLGKAEDWLSRHFSSYITTATPSAYDVPERPLMPPGYPAPPLSQSPRVVILIEKR